MLIKNNGHKLQTNNKFLLQPVKQFMKNYVHQVHLIV